LSDVSLRYLLARAGLVEDRIRGLVAHRRADDPSPDDPFRGLYLTEEAVARLLSANPSAPEPEMAQRTAMDREFLTEQGDRERLRLLRLAQASGLSELDVELLVISLVPDLDSRFERLYGYLNDDVTRRRATVGLALELAGQASASAAARARLMPSAPLVERALVLVEDNERPFLTRGLRVPDRVTAHLLGDDAPDSAVAAMLTDVAPDDDMAAHPLSRAIAGGQRLVYLREKVEGMGAACAVAALAATGRSALCVDLALLANEPEPVGLITALCREALLQGAGLIASPVERLAEVAPQALRRLAGLPVPVVIVGTSTWDPGWSQTVPLATDAPTLTVGNRTALWARALAGKGDQVDPAAITAHFILGPGQVSRAVRAASAAAALSDGVMTEEDLRKGARAQNAAGLERLSRRIEPAVGWDDVVLPKATLQQLHDLAGRARHRDLVLTEWRMRPGGGRGHGITALFAGDSGTGKTMSAEVIAGELGLDLYTINLATVVDKYIGETEKNLERIFAEASGVNAVLLFDEADAIFGKRSEVRDAHDRYANIESAYLLQRMETFDGLAILATNLRANIDDAFTRRLDAIIDFPAPDDDLRLALWERCLAPPLPCGDDLDLKFCARAFTLSGGNIRSAAITAAYLAADAGQSIGMTELTAAVQQEYRKLGRLVLEREFGPYLAR